MCKCCQHCVESCWWNLIEERFCFDESIATYEEGIVKEEKNNNFCDNMAFYDSVSVIAGRAVVTIDPLPEKYNPTPIVVQPGRRLTLVKKSKSQSSINNIPAVVLDMDSDIRYQSLEDSEHRLGDSKLYLQPVKKTVSFSDVSSQSLHNTFVDTPSKSESNFLSPDVELRKKSLMERRQSRSLHLKIDLPKEVPIIRQSSVPKFFLDTPVNQTESSLVKNNLAALQSPMIYNDGFCYDLKSVVQIESEKKIYTEKDRSNVTLIHRDSSSSRLSNIKDKIKLRKSKSSVSPSCIPHNM